MNSHLLETIRLQNDREFGAKRKANMVIDMWSFATAWGEESFDDAVRQAREMIARDKE